MSVMSWGHYPHFPQTPSTVRWRDDLAASFQTTANEHEHTLAYGRGRSYGDVCLAASNHIVAMFGLNRFIAVDWDQGIVRAEAGVTLGDILALAIPQGWFLPVTPGTQYVTLGGAVANDVHGKNHHVRGTFGCHVTQMKLIRSDREPLICSLQENADWYAATIGGLGLTGIIEWVEIQLMPIQSSKMNVQTIRFEHLDEFFALSHRYDASHEYTVAWVDCLAQGRNLGRGVLMAANHASQGELIVSNRRKITVPLTPPISLVNPLTLKILNTVYYQRHPSHEGVADYESFFYPLDSVLHWNRLYGRRGFQQYQCVIPGAEGEPATKALLTAIADSGQGSCLAVLKQCGDAVSPGLLSFPMKGVSLALDFPQSPEIEPLFQRLDEIVRDAGGRLYPAKDAHMSGDDFKRGYPAWETLARLRDPALYSHFWKRVIS